MEYIDIILIGIALSIDACAITVANCNIYNNSLSKKNLWYMPVMFALFQGAMPLIGFYLGTTFSGYISGFAGYITSGIFFILAIKILIDNVKEIKESKREQSEKQENKTQKNFSIWLVLIQAFATSIDAFAIGLTFSLSYTISIFIAISIIIVITFILVCLSILLGKSLGKLFGKYANWIGFGILLILAVKELIFAIIG